MSHTDTLLHGVGTIPGLIGLVHMNKAEQEYLVDTLVSFGPRGNKGFDFGIATLGILARHRKAEFNTKTGEHKPFKFSLSNEDGSFAGYLHALNDYSARLNIEYVETIAENPTEEPEICADHLDGNLGLVTELVVPSNNDILDLNLKSRPLYIASFTVYLFFEDTARPLTIND